MSVSASIPATVQIRRGHLLGLIGVVAALAACVTWAVTAFAFDTGTSGAGVELAGDLDPRQRRAAGPSDLHDDPQADRGAVDDGAADPGAIARPAHVDDAGTARRRRARNRVPAPNAQSSPTAAAVLASMSPETRRYTESIMNLTFEQLAAGAAGQP